MTTITVLGVCGGSGATTLVGLALIGEEPVDAVVTGHDRRVLADRLGALGQRPADPAPALRLIDGGRVDPDRIAASFGAGALVLAAPVSNTGEAALAATLDYISLRYSRELLLKIGIVRTEVHGAARPDKNGSGIRIPYDRALAHGRGLDETASLLRRPTLAAARAWTNVLRSRR